LIAQEYGQVRRLGRLDLRRDLGRRKLRPDDVVVIDATATAKDGLLEELKKPLSERMLSVELKRASRDRAPHA
jgi:hypothetical protein